MVERNSKDEKIIIDYEKIDRQFCELKTANIMSDLFSIIKKHNKIQSGTSRNNIETLKKYVEYLNERLDFIER